MGKFPRRRKYTTSVGKLKEFVENRASLRAQDLRTIADIPSGP